MISFVIYEQYIEHNINILALKIVPTLQKALDSERNDPSHYLWLDIEEL